MATVTVDILEGARTSHDLMGGWTITRIAIVEGLNSGGTLDTAGLCNAAEQAVIAVVGDRGISLSGVSAPTYLKDFVVTPIGATAAKVQIEYRGYPVCVFEYDGVLSMVESNLDNAGNPILLNYTYPTPYIYEPPLAGKAAPPQPGFIRRPNPEAIFIVRWIVAPGIGLINVPGTSGSLATQQMSTLVSLYEGRVNSAPYTIGTLTGAARTWLIEKVAGRSSDGGLTYEAAMTFHYKASNWDTLCVFTDFHTGMPPTDLISGTGSKIVQGFPTAVFPQFNFTGN